MRKLAWSLVGVAVALAAACGGNPSTGSGGSGSGTGPGGAGSGTSSSGTGAGSTGTGGDLNFDAGSPTSSGTGGAPSCTGSSVAATLVPLDMYIMLDKSGSMTDKTGMMGQGVAKWDAVTAALKAFFTDQQSAGIGVGLQFFPLRAAGAPTSCNTQAACGQFGPCLLKICSGNTGLVCVNNADCAGQGPCINLGQCQNDPATLCIPVGAVCNGNKGPCVQVTNSVCLNVDSCDPMDYATPAVPVDLLNGAAPALAAAIDATSPEGATPTGPALQGAVDYAKAWAMANPTHKVVAVLATDGLPTECMPQDTNGIAQIAAAAFNGSPSIPTFVIGVFAGNDPTAQATVDQIAASGGTTSAFYVDANQNVNQAFLDALNAIRGSKLACEYQIPAAPPGQTLDYGQVNVKHTPAGSMTAETIYYVVNAAGCDPMTGGWYYDVDPAMGGTPTKIIVCQETCDSFGLGGQVDIQLGCTTETPPPK